MRDLHPLQQQNNFRDWLINDRQMLVQQGWFRSDYLWSNLSKISIRNHFITSHFQNAPLVTINN